MNEINNNEISHSERILQTREDMDMAASIMIKNKNNIWKNDNLVNKCMACNKLFTFFNRKHHCRYCGNIFCYNCTSKTITIPDFITDVPKSADYWNISHYITGIKGTEQKVCDECYNTINEYISIMDNIKNIINDPVSIDKVWESFEYSNEVKNYYFDYFRNIQYYLPDHKYSDIDRKMLHVNSIYFSCHSKYLVHYIKSIEWHKLNNNDQIEKYDSITNIIMNDKKVYSCQKLYCTRTCSIKLSCDDCINILFSTVNHLPDKFISYLFEIILLTPEQVILCHLLFFINLIKKNSINKLLQQYLFKLLSKSEKLIYHTFWFLNNEKEKSNSVELTNINNFINLYDTNFILKMSNDYLFFKGLIESLDDPKIYLLTNFNKFSPITVPYDPSIQLIDFHIDEITIKDSYTKPVFIPFTTNTGNKICLLFKKENIINDVIVLNLMTLSDIILSESLEVNFSVIVYPIMPLTYNSGMIEIIDKAETVFSINKKKKNILQHIIDRNQEEKIKDVLDKFMYSLVSYTLHSYLLGLGDRHLQNIMITDNGCIFHIDFGFILGKDAYPLTVSNIRLNSDMLDVIGGENHVRYKKYLELCSQGIIILRKYYNMFHILLSQNKKFSEKHIDNFILVRFQPRQSDDIIIKELIEIIRQSHNAYSEIIRDFIHYHSSEKTVQNSVNKMIKNAIGMIKSLTNSD